ncbi:SRPBCC family protein [Brachybacterium phenoliresistens]|uniref:Polyketide cyclase n=1 Tax=Brachybacterium phenoliresistens TaxID=396014 RepID=Z9JRA3_9MICO|nr:SRPBCC family protein [Brachybacterium phenoliresistens]EWS80341.1 polyketide cyclase [Brachybacterium phenoliresistens]
MSTTEHITTATIEADPEVPIIRITRDFQAAPEQVIRAHTDPELVTQWNGPDGLTMTIDHWDARTGGSWRFVHADENGEYAFHGCFHEVSDTRIVQTFTWEGMPDHVSLETLTVEDLGDGWTRLHAQSLVDSFAGRNGWLESGMEVGVNEGYAKLDRVLAGETPRS